MSKVLREHPTLSDVHSGDILDMIWDSSVNGMAFVGTEGEFLACNPTFTKWLGYAPTELENMSFMDVTSPKDTKADMEAVGEIVRGVRDGYSMMKEYRPKSGLPFKARLTVKPWKDAEGKTVLFFFSQIEKENVVQFQQTDELRIIWNFFSRYKKSTATTILTILAGTALAGDAFFEWFRELFRVLMFAG